MPKIRHLAIKTKSPARLAEFYQKVFDMKIINQEKSGAIMGTDPKTSVLNRYLQNWEASNLFVMGGAAFPQNPGHNPTCTIGALAYWSAQAITSQYLKSPGPLVRA